MDGTFALRAFCLDTLTCTILLLMPGYFDTYWGRYYIRPYSIVVRLLTLLFCPFKFYDQATLEQTQKDVLVSHLREKVLLQITPMQKARFLFFSHTDVTERFYQIIKTGIEELGEYFRSPACSEDREWKQAQNIGSTSPCRFCHQRVTPVDLCWSRLTSVDPGWPPFGTPAFLRPCSVRYITEKSKKYSRLCV